MSDFEEKIDAVQQWMQQSRSAEFEQMLTEVDALIHRANLRSQPARLSGAASLLETNVMLKSQLAACETAMITQQKAFNTMELQLQECTAESARLNLLLKKQTKEHQRTQALEREQRALTEALRDTVATMSSTLDLDKVLDHILDTIGRFTPYDGANVLFVESDLVHVVRQRGYVEKSLEAEWLKQRIPLTKLAVLQQMMDLGGPLAISDTTTSSQWIGFPGVDWIQSNVIAPIRLKDKVLGFLSLDSATPGFFTQAHAERLQAKLFSSEVQIRSIDHG